MSIVMSFLSKAKPYLISCGIALAVGGLSALVTAGKMNLYEDVKMPPLSPPSILFPIVCTILFLLMGISAAWIEKKKKEKLSRVNRALSIYALSLFVNFFWSVFFFNLRWFLFSFVWLVLLWVLILLTIRAYHPIDAKAAYLQIPYLLWVSFAGYLNFGVYLLNR